MLRFGDDCWPLAVMSRTAFAQRRIWANHLRHGSSVLEQLILKQGLLVVGAEYALETGVVDSFDGVPPAR